MKDKKDWIRVAKALEKEFDKKVKIEVDGRSFSEVLQTIG